LSVGRKKSWPFLASNSGERKRTAKGLMSLADNLILIGDETIAFGMAERTGADHMIDGIAGLLGLRYARLCAETVAHARL
jgi:hypothetical protein